MVQLKKMFYPRWFFMIILSSVFPVVNFINVNKTQLLTMHWSKLIIYFLIIALFGLLLVKFIKRFVLKSSDIDRIAFGVAIAILIFFCYRCKLQFLGLLALPILGFLLSYFKSVLNWFFIVILFTVSFPTAQIIWYEIQSIDFSNKDLKEHVIEPNLGNAFMKAENPPNVYYFVPDCYMRSDRVKKILGFDNEPFLEKLSKLGFYIAENSHSNYPTTFLSLSSLLEMDYLATEDMKPFSNKKKFFEVLAGNNATVRRFKKHGYLFARMGSGRWDATRCNGKEDICLNKRLNKRLDVSEFDNKFWGKTPIIPVARRLNLIELFAKTTFHDIKQSLKDLDIDNPIFVFGHILMPHPPYVFGADCEPIDLQRIHRERGIKDWWEDKSKDLYLDELKCVNKQLLELVEFITLNDPNSIIVIQADTGTHFGYDKDKEGYIWDIPLSKWSEGDLEENFANLTAIRIPKRFHKWLYPSISQVNTFRLIFSVIENKEPSFIPDYSYSTHYEGAHSFGKVHKYER